MSLAFREKTGKSFKSKTSQEMRKHCQRPGRVNEDGTIQYTTEQAHKDMCDVNKIIAKYDKQGLITHVSKFEAKFGDVTGLEFKAAQDQVIAAQRMFSELPSKIRNEFDNDPAKLLSFMDDPSNRDKAIELGLINKAWSPDSDGLGEHVPLGGNKIADKQSDEPPKPEQGTA